VYDSGKPLAAADSSTDQSGRGRVLRDAGGLPTGDGTIRMGAVFRISGQLASAAELDELADAGVIRIVDLRGHDEDRSTIQQWTAANRVAYSHQPIAVGQTEGLIELALDARAREVVDEAMRNVYGEIVDQHAEQLANTIAEIAQGTPIGFGCAAGRDRTGIVASLLYAQLGVPEELIVDAYARHAPSALQLRPLAHNYVELDDDEPLPVGLEALLTVDRGWISSALERIRDVHGGVSAYLLEHGLPADALPALQRLLVVPTTAVAM
jgi:protein-tyrosine phosphatase